MFRAAAVLAVAGAVALALLGTAGSTSARSSSPHRYESRRYGFSIPVPGGWHRSLVRLVPKLLDPREIVSVGNFAMPVGGGGNCGREPSAAIRRMRPGDALVTVQEVTVGHRVQSRLARLFPSRHSRFDVGRLRAPAGGNLEPGKGIHYTTLRFSEQGRAFEALVYVAGRPTRALRRQVDSILGGLRFRAPRRPRRDLGSDLVYGPYLGVTCERADTTGCDGVGIDFVLDRRAITARASIAGRAVRLSTPGLHSGAPGRDWVGYLRRVGLNRRGGAFHIPGKAGHWNGDPSVHLPVRIVVTFRGEGRLAVDLPAVPLRPGWG